jgi:acyl carrier protein
MTIHLYSERIRSFIVEKFPSARRKLLEDDDPLLENGIVDSMGILEIVEFIEQEFQIHVSDEDLVPENFQTVYQLSSFVSAKLNSDTEAPIER